MALLLALLVANVILHAIVVARFGVGNHNQPFLIFAFVYAALAIAVALSIPFALWAVLILALIGILGLTVTFNQPVRGKTLDKVIWLFDAATILSTGFLLFAR
jgi:hypothetical protein